MFWTEIEYQFWPFWSQIVYAWFLGSSLELGMFCLEKATLSASLIRPSTKALYNPSKVIVGLS